MARRARAGLMLGTFFFFTIPHPCLFLPPRHQAIWITFLLCLRIWSVLCTQFMMMARVVVGSCGSDILCVDFSYFGLCKVLCTEGLWSSAVYLGTS